MNEQLTRPDSSLEDKINSLLQRIFEMNPALQEISKHEHLNSYLQPAFKWNPSEEVFSQRGRLTAIILGEVQRLYGDEITSKLVPELSRMWSAETGAHIYLPRRFDRKEKREGPQMNPLIFQGQTLWAASRAAATESAINLSLSSGRIPPNNANSGVYLEYSLNADPLRLAADRFKETPQNLIPAVSPEELQRRLQPLENLKGNRKISNREYALAEEMIRLMQKKAGGSFTDQIAVAHSSFMNRIFPKELRQITIDSENIGSRFLAELFADRGSLLYQIFSKEDLREGFKGSLAGISTGWDKDESFFYEVDRSRKEPRIVEYQGKFNPDTLSQLLHEGKILPKGILKFFAFMAEGGLCPVGGMFQSEYCGEVKRRGARFIEDTLGDRERAELLGVMPTNIATITPCWGLSGAKESEMHLLNAVELVNAPLSSEDFEKIGNVSGRDSLVLALPTLARLLLREDTDVSYDQLRKLLGDQAIIVKSN